MSKPTKKKDYAIMLLEKIDVNVAIIENAVRLIVTNASFIQFELISMHLLYWLFSVI